MQRRVLAMLVLALLLAAVPTAAQAKGASAATISGGGPGGLPGGPIDLNGDGEPGSGTDLANWPIRRVCSPCCSRTRPRAS